MFKVSHRCIVLRDDAVERKSLNTKLLGHHLLRVEGIQNAASMYRGKNACIVASGIANIIENFPPIIQDGELIVGYNYPDNPYPDWWICPDTEEYRKLLQEIGFSKERVDRYFATRDKVSELFDYAPNPEFNEVDKQLDTEWASIGRCISDNHSVIGYEDVLKYGFEGLLEKVLEYERKNGSSDLYESMKIICKSACRIGEIYADLARKLQLDPSIDEIRRLELEKIEKVCRQVPTKPARSFHEAVQSLWFAHIINTWEDGINANSLGRLDQILYPYYIHDIENGTITKEQVFELICCLWIKLYRDYDVQQSCVGGCLADGSSVVNDLSYMMLDATEQLGFVRCLSVRFSSQTDKMFLRRALEVVGRVKSGIPFFFNDEVMIPALVSKGISLEDARNYTQIGCVETVIPGKSNPHAVSGQTNLLKAVEYAFGNGRSLFNPEFKPGLTTGDIDTFKTYEDFENAVLKQIKHILDNSCKKVYEWTCAARKNAVKPVKSLLTEGCVESNRDFNNHGAKYDYYQIMLGGVPNLADSLIVVKKLVFEDERYSLQYMKEQLEKDFPNEIFRMECIHKVPKYGNDIDEVDEIASRIIEYSCKVLDEMEEKYGLKFHAQPFTFLWMVDHGRVTSATPDGRRKGEIIAYSMSPMQGRDKNGFTALMNTLSKLPGKMCPGTVSAIVEVDPKLYTENNIDYFVDILVACAGKGIANVQFNTIDADTLIDAQKYPDKYSNLAVRVSGFSQKFNLLDKNLQDHIIGRTKHQCM